MRLTHHSLGGGSVYGLLSLTCVSILLSGPQSVATERPASVQHVLRHPAAHAVKVRRAALNSKSTTNSSCTTSKKCTSTQSPTTLSTKTASSTPPSTNTSSSTSPSTNTSSSITPSTNTSSSTTPSTSTSPSTSPSTNTSSSITPSTNTSSSTTPSTSTSPSTSPSTNTSSSITPSTNTSSSTTPSTSTSPSTTPSTNTSSSTTPSTNKSSSTSPSTNTSSSTTLSTSISSTTRSTKMTYADSTATTSNTTSVPHKSEGIVVAVGSIFALTFILSALLLLGIFFYCHLRKKGKCSWSRCPNVCQECFGRSKKGRTRLSSTSSDATLRAEDVDRTTIGPPGQERELFSIADLDHDGGDPRFREHRHQRSVSNRDPDDDYFYDEIFERSAFVDERSNKMNSDLTVEADELDIGVPDLIFK